MEPKVDLIYNGQVQGQFSGLVANGGRLDIGYKRPYEFEGGSYISVYVGGDPSEEKSYKTIALNVNAATLRRDEWIRLDEALVLPARDRIDGVQDLIDAGLVYNLGNGMGTTVLEWHDVSEAGEAELTMDGITRTRNDRPVFNYNFLPIPIIHMDYQINARELATSRNMGNPLDTTMAEYAARRILEKREAMLFTDITYSYGEADSRGRNTIYSYLNFPDRNIVSFNSVPGGAWDESGTDGEDIVKQVNALTQISIDAKHRGPWVLYIPRGYQTKINEDYDKTTPGTTIRERILKLEGLKAIRVNDTLPADNLVLVEMKPETVRLVQGMGLQNVQWQEEGGMILHMKVMTIQVPQIRSDQNGKCGIVHLS